ncbi:hypothetical protein SAMN02910409_1603 [Prevotellaceae bacterium HUN156]|nr:hypothetical protein SAMN02910409_1603 [Prevotellaceae bacterium HUN156]
MSRLYPMRAGICNIQIAPHRLDEVPKNRPSRYITTHSSNFVERYQESESSTGHRIPKGSHRMVSGLVRASIKEEVRKRIKEKLEL